MELNLLPYQSIGPFEFDMKKNSIQNIIVQYPKREFKKIQSKQIKSDHLIIESIILNYSDASLLESVEITKPSTIVIEGKSIFDLSINDAIMLLKESDKHIVQSDSGLYSFNNGICLFGESYDGEKEHFSCAIVFRQGYYDSYKSSIFASGFEFK